jgi:hypothetical protein
VSKDLDWLPPGKTCAICFSIDDVHPGRSDQAYDAGGDLGAGALGHLERLIAAHPQLRTSLCVTPDWRAKSAVPTRRILAAIPTLAARSFLAKRWDEGTMRLDRHPAFVAFLKSLPGVEIVPHGLHHVQRGPRVPLEFEQASYDACRTALTRAAEIMAAAGIAPANGHSPPGWCAPPALLRAMKDAGQIFVASARDVITPVAPNAITAMSGLTGQPLIFPGWVEGLIHIPTNFQATNDVGRALEILESGGLLSVKAHIIKSVGGYTALDGLDRLYTNYLDALFGICRDRFGDGIWWASMGEIAERARRGTDIAAA